MRQLLPRLRKNLQRSRDSLPQPTLIVAGTRPPLALCKMCDKSLETANKRARPAFATNKTRTDTTVSVATSEPEAQRWQHVDQIDHAIEFQKVMLYAFCSRVRHQLLDAELGSDNRRVCRDASSRHQPIVAQLRQLRVLARRPFSAATKLHQALDSSSVANATVEHAIS